MKLKPFNKFVNEDLYSKKRKSLYEAEDTDSEESEDDDEEEGTDESEEEEEDDDEDSENESYFSAYGSGLYEEEEEDSDEDDDEEEDDDMDEAEEEEEEEEEEDDDDDEESASTPKVEESMKMIPFYRDYYAKMKVVVEKLKLVANNIENQSIYESEFFINEAFIAENAVKEFDNLVFGYSLNEAEEAKEQPKKPGIFGRIKNAFGKIGKWFSDTWKKIKRSKLALQAKLKMTKDPKQKVILKYKIAKLDVEKTKADLKKAQEEQRVEQAKDKPNTNKLTKLKEKIAMLNSRIKDQESKLNSERDASLKAIKGGDGSHTNASSAESSARSFARQERRDKYKESQKK